MHSLEQLNDVMPLSLCYFLALHKRLCDLAHEIHLALMMDYVSEVRVFYHKYTFLTTYQKMDLLKSYRVEYLFI